MNILEHAARQALEALQKIAYDTANPDTEKAITALREALEPNREGKYYYKDNACTASSADSPDCICWHDEALAEQACPNGCDTSNGRCVDCPDYVAEQAEQKPVGMVIGGVFEPCNDDVLSGTWELYAAPVRTVDLTDDEIYTLYSEPCSDREMIEFARAVIAADREKNLIK